MWRSVQDVKHVPPETRGKHGMLVPTCVGGVDRKKTAARLAPREPVRQPFWQVFLLLGLSFLYPLGPTRLQAQSPPKSTDLMGMSIEDLMKVEIDSVYAAAGYKQKVNEAPASVTIVTSDEIRRYGYRTLADILRNVPGFYVS